MSRQNRASWVGAVTTIGLAAAMFAALGGSPAQATDWSACLTGTTDRQAVFARAAERSGVPGSILLGVSFMESRWDDHDGAPSTSAGYGPMHLTSPRGIEQAPREHAMGKGDGSREPTARREATRERIGKDALSTLARGSKITGISERRLRADAVANVCGGAAVLARYQREAGGARSLGDWSAAVARYSGADDRASAIRFAEQVFRVIREGKARTTNDGDRVVLRANSSARVDRAAVRQLGLPSVAGGRPDCPAGLGCEWLPAPYKHYGKAPGDYGNHDLANRQQDMDIDYIVIHDTEADWNRTLALVNDPEYVSWHYSLRSVDGHIAQHVDNSDVAWHAGNWYVNMHSIGLEHEGFAAKGADWYTESLYQNSATLVKYLGAKYGVPLDRAHVIGHDQVPGILPVNVRGMHWDPGPYWDWEHYFDLLGSPIAADGDGTSSVVTVAPGFDDNVQPVTGCVAPATSPCPAQGTNFVYLYSQPSLTAPFVTDIGLFKTPDENPTPAELPRPSTTFVSDIGARAAAGQQLVVAQVQGDWTQVWWLGEPAWVYNPASDPDLVASQGQVVAPAGDVAAPVYGRAYPEQAAYPKNADGTLRIPYQEVKPLLYTIKPGQSFVVADTDIETDFYYAKTFRCKYVDLDCTEVEGADRYYQIWLGHRIAYVRAADVVITDGVAAGGP